jgi:ribosomal protein S18 acetylase RimI-like enzyme
MSDQADGTVSDQASESATPATDTNPATEAKQITQAEFMARFLRPFQGCDWVFHPSRGYIVWRLGTGDNVELLHIRTFTRGRGFGKELVKEMLKRLKDRPPYYSVFGFTRVSNEEAQAFYGALGFDLTPVSGVYKDGQAILFSGCFTTLCEQLGV